MQRNIEIMAKFAKENNINLRPHIKTHKIPIIGHIQLKAGAKGIAVAKVGEAEVFAQSGFDDILITNEVIDLGHIKRLIKLNKYTLTRVVVDSEKNILDLSNMASIDNIELEILIDIDVGFGRTGVKPGEPALKLANYIKKRTKTYWASRL